MLPPMTSTSGTSCLSRGHHLQDVAAVAVRRVHDERVDAGLDERAGPLVRLLAHPDRRRPPAAGRPGPWWRCGYCSLLAKSFTVISPASRPGGVDDGQLLHLVLAQQVQRLLGWSPRPAAVTSGIGVMMSRTGVALSETKRMSRLVTMPTSIPAASTTGSAGDAVPGAQRVDLAERVLGRAGDRVGHHARLGPLHEVDLLGLLLDGQVAVQHADAALAGHRDRHPRLGHGVHRAGDQRHLQRDPPGQRGSPCRTSLGTTSDSAGSRSTSSKVRPSGSERLRSMQCYPDRRQESVEARPDVAVGRSARCRADRSVRIHRRAQPSACGRALGRRGPVPTRRPGATPAGTAEPHARRNWRYGGGVHDEPLDPFRDDPVDPSTDLEEPTRPSSRSPRTSAPTSKKISRTSRSTRRCWARRHPRACHRLRGLPRAALLRLGSAARQPAPPARLGPAAGARASLRPRPGPLCDVGVRARLHRRRARHPARRGRESRRVPARCGRRGGGRRGTLEMR